MFFKRFVTGTHSNFFEKVHFEEYKRNKKVIVRQKEILINHCKILRKKQKLKKYTVFVYFFMLIDKNILQYFTITVISDWNNFH